MTRPDPLDRFAPRPPSADETTADALIRYALVRAEAARALWLTGLDADRQLAKFTGYYVLVFGLGSLKATEPAFADNAARRLWVALSDGGMCEEAVYAGLIAEGIDPDEIARVAVEAYEARAAETAFRLSDLGPVVHFAAPHICIDDRHLRQLCAWCGHRLADYDLDRVAVPVGQEGPPPTWPTGALVEVDGGMSVLLGEWTPGMRLPANTCHRRAGTR